MKAGLSLLAIMLLMLTAPALAQTTEAVDSKARGGVVALADRVTALEGLVTQLQSELAGARTALAALEGALAAAQARVDGLEAGLAAADGRIGTLEAGLASANDRLALAEGRIAGLLSDVAHLQASDSTQNDIIIGLRVDLSDAQRIALRSETRSSGGVATKLSLKDPIFTFRVNNAATVSAIDETLATLVVLRCRFALSGCTDPASDPVFDALPPDSLLTFETTVGAWEADLAGLKSLAQSGTVQVTERELLTVLDTIETDMATLADLTQLAAFNLQNRMQAISRAMQTLSNIAKAMHDTLVAIINNLRA